METRYLIVGGGLAGYKAAKGIRALDSDGSIHIVARESHLPYDRPPLTKEFLRGEKDLAELFYESQDDLAAEGIEIHTGVSVTRIDPEARLATLSDGQAIGFEKALLATGGTPIRLRLPGAELGAVHTLRTIEDAQRLQAAVKPGTRAVVIGAGFIGMELAASLTKLGAKVAIVEAMPRIWPRFMDPTLSAYFQDYATARGIAFHLGEKVVAFHGDASVRSVVMESGLELPCDFSVVAVGIRPNTELASQAGLQVENGIVVDAQMQTSAAGIYAAGDAVSFADPIFGKRRRVEHWGHADYTGELAGRNMAGAQEVYDLVSYAWSEIFDLHLEFVGDETEYDEVLMRGSLHADRFTLLYLKGHRLRAFFSANMGTDFFGHLERLIRSGADLSAHKALLQDPDSDLSALA